jgi:hypothetical protein
VSKHRGADRRPTGRALFNLLAVGVIVWIAASLAFMVWFFAGVEDPGLATGITPLSAWSVGYLPGAVALALHGSVQLVRRRVRAATFLWTLAVYLLPAVLTWAVLKTALLAMPRTAAESGLHGTLVGLAAPLLVALYVAGLLYGYASRQHSLTRTALRTLAPPIVGVAALTVWLLATAFGSAEFRARGAFDFTVERTTFADDGLVVDASLAIRRDGSYHFSAFYMEILGGTAGGRADDIQWLDGGTPPQKAGRYRVRLVWNDLHASPGASERRLFFEIRERRANSPHGPPIMEFRVPLETVAPAGRGA